MARPGSKRAFRTVERALTKGGLSALDGRSSAARAVSAWKQAVAEDLGGVETLSQAQLTLLDLAAVDVALIALADDWIRSMGAGILSKRRGTYRPVVRDRQRVADHLAGLLKQLGLERRARVQSIEAWLAEGAGAKPHRVGGVSETAPSEGDAK
jgi:hypothetical protein